MSIRPAGIEMLNEAAATTASTSTIDDEHKGLLVEEENNKSQHKNQKKQQYGATNMISSPLTTTTTHSSTARSTTPDDGVATTTAPNSVVRFEFPPSRILGPNDEEDEDDTEANTDSSTYGGNSHSHHRWCWWWPRSLRRWALLLSLNVNILITIVKFIAYLQSFSLSVLAALLDSVLDILSQLVLNYTERHSSMQRSSAHYPAGASRLEPIGVLTCAALMGMASFEVLKESFVSLIYNLNPLANELSMVSFYNMLAIIVAKWLLLWMCQRAAHRKVLVRTGSRISSSDADADDADMDTEAAVRGLVMHHHHHSTTGCTIMMDEDASSMADTLESPPPRRHPSSASANAGAKAVVQLTDPTLEAIAQDHFNDILSNTVAAVALLVALREPNLWFLDPIGAILISLYIIYSWYQTGREQIEHLTGKSAPEDLIDELKELAQNFDDRMQVDTVRAYHFGPKFLVEIEVVMPKTTLLFESHDVGMELQYEIESREEVERCFVHIDYQQRPYDEHVVSKVPELREKYRPAKQRSTLSL